MKRTCFKLALPLTLATLLANAEELSFTKNLPIESKTMMVNENPLSTYDNRVNFGPDLFNKAVGVGYARIKADSTYIGIGTYIASYGAAFTAMGGYNFLLSPKGRLTPAAGLVYFAGTPYIFPLAGLYYEHAFNSVFSVGTEVTTIITGNSNVIVTIPFTLHFGAGKRWEVRLAPSLSHIKHSLTDNNRMNFNVSMGYRF
jgi:hypothetical protein